MSSFIVDTLLLIDQLLATYVVTLWSRIVGHYNEVIKGLIILAIIFLAVRLLMGKSGSPIHDVMWKLALSIGVFVFFARNWDAYNFVIYNLAVNGANEMIGVVMGGSTPFEELDIIAVHMFGAAAKIAEHSDIGMIFAWILAALYMIAGMVMVANALFMIIVAKLATSILLGLGPIFLIAAIFNATRGVFDGWIKLLIQYALQSVIAVAIIAFCILIIKDFIVDAGLGRVPITIQLVGVQIILLGTSAGLLSQVGRISASLAGGYALSANEVFMAAMNGINKTASTTRAGFNGAGGFARQAGGEILGGLSAARRMQDSRVNRIRPAPTGDPT